jgi:hypothetical protein
VPRFYISFQGTRGLQKDDDGLELPGFEEARAAAITSAREVLADDVKYATDDPLLAVIITNQDGNELARIPAKDILPEPLK